MLLAPGRPEGQASSRTSCKRPGNAAGRGGLVMKKATSACALSLAAVAAVGLFSNTALAQAPAAGAPAPTATPKPAALGLYVYPGASQDAAQQAKDENECYTWAQQQTGID